MMKRKTRWVDLLVLTALPAAAQAAQVGSTTSVTPLNALNATVIDAVADGVAATASRSVNQSLGQFDATQGVLIGASATLAPRNALRQLAVTGSDGTASVNSVWTLGGNSTSGLLNAATTATSPDNSWNTLSMAALSNLDSFVGTGTINSQLVTTLSAQRNGTTGTGTTAAITNTTTGATNALNTYDVTLTYSYLQHANGSWNTDVDNDFLSFNNLGTSATAFSLYALSGSLSASETTAMDLLSIDCTGDCQSFTMNFATFQDLVAGSQQTGTIAAVQGLAAGTYRSTYTFSLADDSSVGVASSQSANTLTLNVRSVVSAVPDAPGLALLCAGALALVGRRRR